MLTSGLFLLGTMVAYIVVSDGKSNKTAEKPNEKVIEPNKQELTLQYFSNLTLAEQERYFQDNLDLRDYKDTLTDNKWFNAKRAAAIAAKMDKEFTNINKVY